MEEKTCNPNSGSGRGQGKASGWFARGPMPAERFTRRRAPCDAATAQRPGSAPGSVKKLVLLEDVGMRYGAGPEILRDVTFTLAPGSFHFLVGPSGAGKSSLLRLMYLAQRPTTGLVSLFGRNVADLARDDMPGLRRRIGVIFQDFRLIDHLSAFDNVALPLRIAGARESEIRKHVPELLSWVGLPDHLEALPATLAGGQQPRVAIAH